MKKLASALLVLSASVSVPALAADDSGLYFNLDAGNVKFSDARSQYGASSFSDSTAATLGVGYRFNRHLAIEAGYSDAKDSNITTIGLGTSYAETLKTSSMQLAAVGILPLGEAFSLFGKAGAARTRLEYSALTATIGLPGVTQSMAVSKTSTLWGLGVQLNASRNLGIRLQYLNLGKVQLPGPFVGGAAPNIGVTITSLGLVFAF